MSANVLRTTASCDDLRRILAFFLDQNEPGVAARFVNGYEKTLTFVADFPDLGIPWESEERRLNSVRVKPIQGFDKYLVFYRLSGNDVFVLRIFHGHQNIDSLL